MIRRPPRSTLFPYTTLFRSQLERLGADDLVRAGAHQGPRERVELLDREGLEEFFDLHGGGPSCLPAESRRRGRYERRSTARQGWTGGTGRPEEQVGPLGEVHLPDRAGEGRLPAFSAEMAGGCQPVGVRRPGKPRASWSKAACRAAARVVVPSASQTSNAVVAAARVLVAARRGSRASGDWPVRRATCSATTRSMSA